MKYLFRTRNAGVWVGSDSTDAPFPQLPGAFTITDARRVWRWENSANELTQLARDGIVDGDIGPPTDWVTLNFADVCEVHRLSEEAAESFRNAPEFVHDRT